MKEVDPFLFTIYIFEGNIINLCSGIWLFHHSFWRYPGKERTWVFVYFVYFHFQKQRLRPLSYWPPGPHYWIS